MISEKEKALLDYLNEQAKALAEFMKQGGYEQDDFRYTGITVTVNDTTELLNGTRVTYDNTELSFCCFHGDDCYRLVRRAFSPYTGEMFDTERLFDKDSEKGGINV